MVGNHRLLPYDMTALHVVAAGRRYVFDPGTEVVCGRGPTAQVLLTGDTRVGRMHARLVFEDGAWFLIDAQSSNGTWVGQVRVDRVRIDRETAAHLGNPVDGALMLVTPAGADAPRTLAAPILPQGGVGSLERRRMFSIPGAGRPRADRTALVGSDSAPVMVLRLGAQTLVFPSGLTVRIGREEAEAVTDHPLVSRQHGILTTDATGTVYTDTSSRGTFLDGRRLKEPLRVTASVVLRLGDPATGEELGVTPPLSNERMVADRRRADRTRPVLIGAAILALLVLVGAGVAVRQLTRTAPADVAATPPATLSAADLHHAETATVRLLEGTPDSYNAWGSGTLISADGLILTNAHVAAPATSGAAVARAEPGADLGPNPRFLTVEFITDDASAAVAKYRAKVAAVDGYLDLAVLVIYADANGGPVDRTRLHLPFLTFGDVAAAHLDDGITILGFPGVSGSDSITVTSGVISTFIPDPLHHVNDPRFELETTARVAHGNSGGAAIDNAGRLIGVPSLEIPGQGADLSWRLRSTAEAGTLVAAVKSGQPYTSRILVPADGLQQVGAAIGADRDEACTAATSMQVGSKAIFGVQYANAPAGVDVAFLITAPNGTVISTDSLQDQSVPGLPELVLDKGSGCVTYEVPATAFDSDTMPAGIYTLQLLAGPDLEPVAAATALTVAG
jgi:putative serine protease PepD